MWQWVHQPGITLRQNHLVINTGPYALVRHPIYTGLLLTAWATAATDNSGLGMAGAVHLPT